MRDTILPISKPTTCRCGTLIRFVNMEDGRLITIDEAPSPDGDLIPWPSPSPTGIARARRISVPITDGVMWREHECQYTRPRGRRTGST